MNQLIVLARVATQPLIMTTANDSRVAGFRIEVAAYRQEDPPITMRVTARGKVAEDVAANIQEGAYLTLAGRLQLDNGHPPELQISEFHAVAPVELPGINSIVLVGRAGRDAEARYFESGSVVANTSLAVNRIRRDDPPDWFNLEIWAKQAQVAVDYVRRGSLMGVAGSISEQRWTDRTSGEERSKIVVRVTRLDLLGSRRDSEENFRSTDEEAPF